MAAFHPTPEMLVDHASGALSEPVALIVETHLALCPTCRGEIRRLEAVGGALLEAIDPIPLRPRGLDALLARLDEPAPPPAAAPVPAGDGLLPEPLRSRAAGGQWRRMNAVIDEMPLSSAEPGVTARLLRIRAGQAVPRHTHGGPEYTLVLAGGFSDHNGHFGRGDMVVADSEMVHTPVADSDQDCVCLAVTDGGLRLTGPIGRIVNLFWRF